MIEIPFWQSAAAGAVLAALITALSSWFQRRRDDRIESRKTRREAGADAIQVAYRLRSLTIEVSSRAEIDQVGRLVHNTEPSPDREESNQVLWRQWVDAWTEAGQHSMTARALAAPGVGSLLSTLREIAADWFTMMTTDNGWNEGESLEFRDQYDAGVREIVAIVRADAKIDAGLESMRAQTTRLWSRVKKGS